MGKFPNFMFLVILIVGAASSVGAEKSFRRHINSIAYPNSSNSKSNVGGCRQKPLENIPLIGVAVCTTSKPLKLTRVLKMGKDICAKNWNICSITDKAVQKLSWKSSKMPKGCFAFNYGKAKAAGYGNHCQSNLYFDGILCCPAPGSKVAHHLNTSPYQDTGKYSHRFNFVK